MLSQLLLRLQDKKKRRGSARRAGLELCMKII